MKKLIPKRHQKEKPQKPHRPNHAGSGIAWAWMEIEAAELAREKARKHGFAVYCALCILESKAGSNHKAKFTASILDLMKITGLGKMSVCEAIKSLRKHELMTVISGDMKGNSNVYTLHNVRPPDGLPRSAGRTTQVRPADNPSPPSGQPRSVRRTPNQRKKRFFCYAERIFFFRKRAKRRCRWNPSGWRRGFRLCA